MKIFLLWICYLFLSPQLRAGVKPAAFDLSDAVSGEYYFHGVPRQQIVDRYGKGALSKGHDTETHTYRLADDLMLDLVFETDIAVAPLSYIVLRRPRPRDPAAAPRRPIKFNFRGVQLGDSESAVRRLWGKPFVTRNESSSAQYYGLPANARITLLLYDPKPPNTGRSVEFLIHKDRVFRITIVDG